MATAVLAGSTGQVGSHILTTLLSHPTISTLHAYTRRDLPPTASANPKLHPIKSSNLSTWPSLFPSNSSIFLSGLATTRAAAGGTLESQIKIDRDANAALAEAAARNGISTYVLISGVGANSKSWFAYTRMKGELEEAVQRMGFRHVVILRPGFISNGQRGARGEAGMAEMGLRRLAGVAGKVSTRWLKDGWAQDAEVIARAAVNAGVQCLEGKRKEEGVWVLGPADIVRLGRTEWAMG
ncbi:MAG: hypothetical protein Q9227_009068 [Pyrenula ochraceoflavens]